MRIGQKLPLAERQIAFITQHDDASIDERQVMADRLKRFIDDEMIAARKRSDDRLKSDEAEQRKRMSIQSPK